jgi:uncharacterized protein (TIGR02453 family)
VSDFAGFTPELFQFLHDLAGNNSRDWFKANQPQYEAVVREPARAFVRAVGEALPSISAHFVADDRKVGGSIMRPQRDTRFSKDKTPYKTNLGIHFKHARGKDVHAPGFYLHIHPEEIFLGVGLWRPDKDALAAIRRRIDTEGEAWTAARDAVLAAGFQQAGESLKRPPKGYDKEHPRLVDLKRKDHIISEDLDVEDVLGPEALDFVVERFAAASPYQRFLVESCGLDY